MPGLRRCQKRMRTCTDPSNAILRIVGKVRREYFLMATCRAPYTSAVGCFAVGRTPIDIRGFSTGT